MPHLPDFEGWAIFARVAERGSFSAAAEDLSLAKTTVSKAVSRLEERMGATLLHRTTRKLSLTESGRLSLDRAMRILADGRGLEADILEEAAVPRGLLRLAVTTGFGVEALAPILPRFLKQFPKVEIDLFLSESRVDLVAEGYDLVIQIGDSVDSSLRISRLFSFRRPLVASPEFLEAHGTPRHPRELASLPPIVPTHVPWAHEWTFEKKGEGALLVRVNGGFRVNNAAAMVPALVDGIGIGLIPEFFVWREIASAKLIEVLPDWVAPAGPVYVVTPPGRARPARVRVLLEFIREHFATQPWAQGIER